MFCRAVVSCSTGTVAVTSPMELAASPSQHGLLCIPGARALVKPMSSSSTAAIANSKKKRKKERKNPNTDLDLAPRRISVFSYFIIQTTGV